MIFDKGTSVYTADDKKIGDIERVVWNPRTNRASHLILSKGFIFPEEKVISLDYVDQTSEDQVKLNEAEDSLPELPKFEETAFLPMPPGEMPTDARAAVSARPLFWYPSAGAAWWKDPVTIDQNGNRREGRTVIQQNIPDDTIALKEGARVMSRDGQDQGTITRVHIDPESQRVSHFLLEQGFFNKTHKLIPTMWIQTVGEDAVWLDVSASFVESLPDQEL